MASLFAKQTRSLILSFSFLGLPFLSAAVGAETEVDVSHGRDMLHSVFEHEVEAIENDWFDGISTLEEWEVRRQELRGNLAEMLGLSPMPPKTDLKATVTGKVDHPEFTIENLHFQSLPGLYVTANLYLPKNVEGPPPVILYLNGHARHIVDGISYGNKFSYQHNPIWYARQGIACLIIDTIDHGEIQGIHHGTFRHNRWWWYNRGYTPGAIEVWNTIRGIDYLETRDDVDSGRIGTTGRSGGGMYSWLILALDDRVMTGTPTAGITDLRDHLITGVIRGHCDCNYWNNFHRLDTTVMAALAAPRPVRLLNSDDDAIFPTGGIGRIEERVAKVYALYGKEDHWDVYISEGPHRDTRELQLASYPWMYRWLTGNEMEEVPETGRLFEAEELRVFQEIPSDQLNTTIDQVFLPKADTPELPETRWEWELMKADWMRDLRKMPFGGWPSELPKNGAKQVDTFETDGIEIDVREFSPQPALDLRLWIFKGNNASSNETLVQVLDNDTWLRTLAALQAVDSEQAEAIVGPGARSVAWPEADPDAWSALKELVSNGKTLVLMAPRGVGPTFYEEDRPNRGDTITRSFPMLGQTLESMQIWDLRSALTALRATPEFAETKFVLKAEGPMAGVALYASLFDEPLAGLQLKDVPANHENGPYLLNIAQITDLPQIFAMAQERSEIQLEGNTSVRDWSENLQVK